MKSAFFFFSKCQLPECLWTKFLAQLVQETGREEHLFYTLSEKAVSQEHYAITKNKWLASGEVQVLITLNLLWSQWKQSWVLKVEQHQQIGWFQ